MHKTADLVRFRLSFPVLRLFSNDLALSRTVRWIGSIASRNESSLKNSLIRAKRAPEHLLLWCSFTKRRTREESQKRMCVENILPSALLSRPIREQNTLESKLVTTAVPVYPRMPWMLCVPSRLSSLLLHHYLRLAASTAAPYHARHVLSVGLSKCYLTSSHETSWNRWGCRT